MASYYIWLNEARRGPYSVQELRALVQADKASDESLVIEEDQYNTVKPWLNRWVTLKDALCPAAEDAGGAAMPKTGPPYTPEFRQQMVGLVKAGRDPQDLSQEFGPTPATIRKWVAQAETDQGSPQGGPTVSIDVPQQRNRFAIAGLSLGIASVFLFEFSIFPILAVVFAAIGLAKAGASGGRGRGQAWAGLALGVLYMLARLYRYGNQ